MRRRWTRLVLVAVALRVAFSLVAVHPWPLTADAAEYSRQAEELLRDFPGSEQYYWPPGTSYVLAPAYAVFGASAVIARLVMIAVSVASVVACVHLARRLVVDERVAWRAGWVLALMPSAVLMPSQPFSFDVTMLGVTLCAVWALVAWDRRQPGWCIASGLALGVAVVARPGSASLFLALLVAAGAITTRLWKRRDYSGVLRLVGGVVTVGVFAALLALPAVVHNARSGAGPTVSTNNDGNLLLGNNPYTRNYKTWHQGQHPFAEFPARERLYLERHFTPGGDADRRAEMRNTALTYMAEHPGTTALRTVNRARAFWGFDYAFSNGLRVDLGAPTALVLLAAAVEVGGYIVFGLLVLAGLILGRGYFRGRRWLFVIALVLAYQLPYLIAFSGGRWHLPVLALLAPVAAAGLTALGPPATAVRRVASSRALVISAVVFLLLQVEYAWFVLLEAAL